MLLHLDKTNFFALKILDTSSAASLFVTLVGALLVRHQFALGVLPRINYKSAVTIKPNSQNHDETFQTWRVEIRNTGLGSAIINRTEYMVELTESKCNYNSYEFGDVIKQFSGVKLVRNQDYWIEKITPGFSLSPKDDCFVFEIKEEYISNLKYLSLILYFQGQLGDKYRREIFLIPRH